MSDPETIVSEISMSWPNDDDTLLSVRFEKVIEVNSQKGYRLDSWKFQTAVKSATEHSYYVLYETIIAVFVKKAKP